MQEQKFLYKNPKIKGLIVAILLFGCIAVFSYSDAIARTEFVFKGIHLSQDTSVVIFWVFFVFSAGATLTALYLAILLFSKRIKKQRYVILSDTSISAPIKAISDKIITIKYSDIKDIKFSTLNKLKFFQIIYNGGQLNISSTSFSESDFMKICAIVANAVKPKL